MAQDYLYGSARVRVLENRLLGSTKTAALAEEKNIEGVWRRLREYGVEPVTDKDGSPLREATLSALLSRAYAEIGEMFPEDRLLALWRYPYDCNNVKAAIKAFVRGVDPHSMMIEVGSVAPEQVISMVASGNFAGLPPKMSAAAAASMERFAKSRDPQTVDLLLDRACYADMTDAAASNAFVRELVRCKLDLTDLLILIRVLRMQSGELGAVLLRDAWLEGGSFDIAFAEMYYRLGEEALWAQLRRGAYAVFADAAGEGKSLAAVECAADNCLMERLREVKYVSFGAEVPTAYLLATEYEVRNLRILLAGKEAGVSPESLREELRKSYV